MKLFHLADLHFEKNIYGYSLIEMGDQPFWMEQIIKKAEELKPDGIMICGDVYDRAVPSKEAVNLFDEFLTRLSGLRIPVLIIAGNHDSGSRLAFADQLLCHQNIYIAGEVKREISHVVLEDCYGAVHFYLVPYLFPAAVNVLFERDDIKDYDTAMSVLLSEQEIDIKERNVILAHQFVVADAGKPVMGGSETTVGGIGQIDAAVFNDFDYVALGHIHNAQRMGREIVRYAGSPLCYHFSEAGQKKGLTVVELGKKGEVSVTVEELPMLHAMKEVSGTMEELLRVKEKSGSYLRAVIKQEILPPQAVETLRSYFEGQNCILMEVVRESAAKKRQYVDDEAKNIRNRSLEELFFDFYRFQHDGEMPEQSLSELIGFAAEQTRNSFGEESESERRKELQQLIDYAAKCSGEEEA